jgi:penicillin-binding protein 2
MLILDQLKRGDRTLRALAGTVLGGVVILLAGLWYVQIIAAQRYRNDLEIQSFRTVRVPAVRGKILDRNGVALADNRPSYNINLYLEELRSSFRAEYTNRVRKEFFEAHPERRHLSKQESLALERMTRFRVVSNLLSQVSYALNEPPLLDERVFHRHYSDQRSLPFPLLKDISFEQVALYLEKSGELPAMDLDVQPMRVYPFKTSASHLLGHLRRDNQSGSDDEFPYKFRLPDYVGARGIEWAFDKQLRGQAGVKSVLVNSMAYRQREDMLLEPEPGQNVVLAIDRAIQQAADTALANSPLYTRGAAIAMDVNTGDVLAMASWPAFDPNIFLSPIPRDEWERLNDEQLRPLFNNAAYGTFPAASTFKIIVALAGLESGILDPHQIYHSTGRFVLGGRSRPVGDTAGPGAFDFARAFYKSSNPYFIHYGLEIGPERLIEMAHRFQLGERTGIEKGLEAKGYLPSTGRPRKRDGSRWMDGDTANFSIGHGEILVTPLQMACLTAAVANGGKLLQPRLVLRIEPQPDAPVEETITFPAGVVRGEVNVSQRSLDLVRRAMLDDLEHVEGTGHRYGRIPGYKIGGKTGTAKLQKEVVTWFVSFAPYDNPQYAVAVVISGSGGISGSGTCAPVARQIYQALIKRDAVGKQRQSLTRAE